MPLSKALAELARQTGNEVQDRRQAREDVLLKLHFKDDSFWEVLDAIAKAADARVSVFQKDGVVALVDGPFQVLPVSYNGLFRVTLKRIAITHVLEADTRMCQFARRLPGSLDSSPYSSKARLPTCRSKTTRAGR